MKQKGSVIHFHLIYISKAEKLCLVTEVIAKPKITIDNLQAIMHIGEGKKKKKINVKNLYPDFDRINLVSGNHNLVNLTLINSKIMNFEERN